MRPSRIELLVLPFLLPFSSALSLASFQVVVSNTLSKSCLRAYNATIPDCTASDFTNGNPCSEACVEGLGKIDASVKQACSGVIASQTTLLGTVLNGNMPKALCPNIAGQGGKSTAAPSAQPTETVSTTPSAVPSSTSVTSTEDAPSSTLTSSATPPAAIQTESSTLSTKTTKKPSSTSSPGANQSRIANSGAAGSPFQITLPNQGVGRGQSFGRLSISVLTAAVVLGCWL